MKTIGIILVALFAIATIGCGKADVETTKQEEDHFRNPSKNPPPEAAEGMRKAMEKVPGNTGGN